MLTLALETATIPGSVALTDELETLAIRHFEKSERTVQWLAPAIRQLLVEQELTPADLDLIGLVEGPGSFTGLRIGVTTAKMLGYALECPLVALNTLDVIAFQANETSADRLDVVMNAQRKELFVKSYQKDDGHWTPLADVQVLSLPAWMNRLGSGVAVTGPELARIDAEQLGEATIVDSSRWQPTAISVADLARQHLAKHPPHDLWKLVPQYYRKSYVE